MNTFSPIKLIELANSDATEQDTYGTSAAIEHDGNLYIVNSSKNGYMSLSRLSLDNEQQVWIDLGLCMYKSNPFAKKRNTSPVLLLFRDFLVLIWVSYTNKICGSRYYPHHNSTWSPQFVAAGVSGDDISDISCVSNASVITPLMNTHPHAVVRNNQLLMAWVDKDDHGMYYAELLSEGFTNYRDELPSFFGFYYGSMVFKNVKKIERDNEFGIYDTSSPTMATLPTGDLMYYQVTFLIKTLNPDQGHRACSSFTFR